MPTADGWLNVFRLSCDDPVQDADADLRAVHGLFGGGGPSAWLTTTVDDALAAMDDTGTERALVAVNLGGSAPRDSVKLGDVDFGLALCARAPERFRLVLQAQDLSSPQDAARLVRRHGELDQVAAIGVFPGHLGVDITDRRLYPLYSACIDRGLPVRINVGVAGPMVASRHQHPELLEDLLLDFPELTVIACHMGHPWEELVIRLIMKFPNLHLMTSGYLPKYFAPALVKFMGSSRGAGRILFGSDHPGSPLDRDWRRRDSCRSATPRWASSSATRCAGSSVGHDRRRGVRQVPCGRE
jgi:predicted TIM-barrel fold metal-dependent hydrolase